MIRLTVMHPNVAGNTFNLAYYMETHIPLAQAKLGAACKAVTVDAGVGGMAPGSSPTYVVITQMLFDSVDAMRSAFAQAGNALRDDLANFTGAAPVMQISEVRL
jgi:uncharacterized protein (TIGR02118 family)